MVGGRLYVQNALGLVEALDPATGRTVWTQKPLAPGLAGLTGATVARGIAYWRSGADERLFTIRKNLLFALNVNTGDPIPTFGQKGQLDLQLGVGADAAYNWGSAPIVVKDVVVVGSNLGDFPTKRNGIPGDVRGYDARSGRLLWTFHVIPHPGACAVASPRTRTRRSSRSSIRTRRPSWAWRSRAPTARSTASNCARWRRTCSRPASSACRAWRPSRSTAACAGRSTSTCRARRSPRSTSRSIAWSTCCAPRTRTSPLARSTRATARTCCAARGSSTTWTRSATWSS